MILCLILEPIAIGGVIVKEWYFKVISFFERLSLKNRISLMFGLSTFFLLMFTVLFSYQSMSSILTNKLHATFNSNLKQVKLSIENTVDNLNYVAQQIEFSENYKIDDFLHSETSYEKVKNHNEFRNELNVILFSNPGIGLFAMYLKDEGEYLFNSHGVKDQFSLKNGPILIEGYNTNVYGPHKSMERYKEKYVLSLTRKLKFDNNHEIYIYLESSLDLTSDLLEVDNVINDASYIILNNKNEVIYSENELFPIKSLFNTNARGDGEHNGFYWFQEETNRGWSVIALIPISKYNQEMNEWVILMIYITIIFILVSLTAALFLWKTIYKPLNEFHHEIMLMSNSNFHAKIITTNIPEFANLTNQFRHMKSQIANLIKEIEQKERIRADLEVEKLKHQINPHFLMNTLDTAKWLAKTGEKEEVVKLLSSLNKLLYYNMGKLGAMSTLEEELDSVKQYLILQQMRYDITSQTIIHVPPNVMHSPIPRFILQPIVENSINHGFVDDGEIIISVSLEENMILIEVKDDGRGMTQDKMNSILHEHSYHQSENGMGIGLNYVKRVMERAYGDFSKIEIQSVIGKGTKVSLWIPFIEGEK